MGGRLSGSISTTAYQAGIAELMKDKIRTYFTRLGLSDAEAARLHHHYYTEYGLAIRGLVRHHKVDPLDYDKHCDAALPLETVLRPDQRLQELLRDVDREKVRVWALTNAYVNVSAEERREGAGSERERERLIPLSSFAFFAVCERTQHAVRVLKLLGLSEYFEGVVSCDYGASEFSCKPEAEFFAQALSAVSTPPPVPSSLYFVDDSALNIKGAHSLGWGHCVLFDEFGDEAGKLGGLDKVAVAQDGEERPRVSVVTSMHDLRTVWKDIFVSPSPQTNGTA
ncbi:SPOSA6832_01650, partial [Sporobolomyces salmonicolor]